MISNLTKANVLRSVIAGCSVAQAGKVEKLGTERARTALNRICELLNLPNDLDAIHAEPDLYLESLAHFESLPQFELRTPLVAKLRQVLGLRSCRQLTPAMLAQVTASQLINQGISIVALADLQQWLLKHDLSLRHSPPVTEVDFREARKAIALLDAFDFDTESLEWQMNHLARPRARGRGRRAAATAPQLAGLQVNPLLPAPLLRLRLRPNIGFPEPSSAHHEAPLACRHGPGTAAAGASARHGSRRHRLQGQRRPRAQAQRPGQGRWPFQLGTAPRHTRQPGGTRCPCPGPRRRAAR